MDTQKLFLAFREETLPRLDAVREALAQLGDTGELKHVTPVREFLHRVAGTAGMVGAPSLTRLGRIGEDLAMLALDGEVTPGARLAGLLSAFVDAIEDELGDGGQTAQMPQPEMVAQPSGLGRVLLASDEGVSSKIFTRILEDAGLTVRREAVDSAAEHLGDVDAVLVDLGAAEAGQLSAAEAFATASAPSRIPLIFTGKRDAGDAALRTVCGAHPYLLKPVAPDVLEQAVKTAVERRRRVQAARARAPTARVPSVAQATGLKILIVDDSRVIRGLLRDMLVEAQAQPLEAEDGEQALALVQKDKPDAVISDIQMPGMDGAELTRRIRALPGCAALPVVVLSALDDEASRQKGLAAGANAYLVKSLIDGPGLLAALKKAGVPLSERR